MSAIERVLFSVDFLDLESLYLCLLVCKSWRQLLPQFQERVCSFLKRFGIFDTPSTRKLVIKALRFRLLNRQSPVLGEKTIYCCDRRQFYANEVIHHYDSDFVGLSKIQFHIPDHEKLKASIAIKGRCCFKFTNASTQPYCLPIPILLFSNYYTVQIQSNCPVTLTFTLQDAKLAETKPIYLFDEPAPWIVCRLFF